MTFDSPTTAVPSSQVDQPDRPLGSGGLSIADDPTAVVPAVTGACPPRAWITTDAPQITLNGTWRFAYFPTADTGIAWDDAGDTWGQIPVPAHWQLHGFGAPAYTNIAYPFPMDAPRVPDDNPTGEYRRIVDLTQEQLAASGRWVLRFEGVDSAMTLAVNGTVIGTSTGSRLPVEFDVTEVLHHGDNLIAARVHQWSTGSYLEDQDQWWLSGIFRDVTLLHRPDGGIDDVRIHTAYDHRTGLGTVRADVDTTAAARIQIPELGVDMTPGDSATIPVEPWSAESPRRYEIIVSTAAETARLNIGFRTVAIRDGLLEVNGVPVLLRGVNRHEFHPTMGRALTRDVMEHDVYLMKQHHMNAVRTSHYPPHPAFIDLCDEHGLYVMDECDLETHGYESHDWVDNPTNDPRWEAEYVSRAVRMVRRDLNHPSIIMWSLGNEAGRGVNIAPMAAAVRELDDRPIHYEPDQRCDAVDVYSRMYAPFDEVDAIGRRSEPQLSDPVADAKRRAAPFLLCEYAHAMGNGPGGLAEYEALFEKYPRLQGGYVWEWIDHGIATTTEAGAAFYGYGGDFGEEIHDGSFICDGLLLPDRTPSPGLIEFAAVNEPLRITVTHPEPGQATVMIRSRYQHQDTTSVTYSWRVEADGELIKSGDVAVPVLAAGDTTQVTIPVAVPPSGDTREWWLTVEAVEPPRPWAPEGLIIGRGQGNLSPLPQRRQPVIAPPLARNLAVAQEYRVGPARFDARGTLVQLGDTRIEHAGFDAWRPPTENDRYLGSGVHISNAVAWRQAALDRLRERVDGIVFTDDSLTVHARVAGAASRNGFAVTYHWSVVDHRVRLELTATPEGPWEVSIPRMGYTFAAACTSPDDAQISWFGLGPGESYADSSRGVYVGRWSQSVTEFGTNYVVPQENGCRRELRHAELSWTDPQQQAHQLGIHADPVVDLSVRAWSNAQITAAHHAVELPQPSHLWVHLDAGQDGLGSATCGPAVAIQHRYLPAVATVAVELSIS